MKKILRWILIVIVVGVAVLFFARNLIVRKAAEVGVKRVTGFPLEIGALDIGVFSGQVGVSNLKLTNPPEFSDPRFVDMPLFKVDYASASMLSGAPHIKELVVNVNEVVVVKNQKGQTNANVIQERLSPAASGQTGGSQAPASKKKPYRVDLIRVHIGTVIIKDFSKSTPTERKMTLNRDVVFRDVNESTSISALVMNTILGPLGDVAGDLVKGVGGVLTGTTQNLQKGSKGLFDTIKKAVPGQQNQ
jgi:uncharacterized protein involved in outer membrane biogenesis